MNLKELNFKITNFFKNLSKNIKGFPTKFKRMTLGEQIAYGCIGLGILLIVISLFLF